MSHLQHSVVTQPKDSRFRSLRSEPLLGFLIMGLLSTIYLIDWAFPFEADDPTVRFWPHLARGAFLVLAIAVLVTRGKRLRRLTLLWPQAVWLLILYALFIFNGRFDRTIVLYMSYYAFWVIVLWVIFCVVWDGALTIRQVALTGAVLGILTITRLALYQYWNIWIGGSNGTSGIDMQATYLSYSILFFTAMALLQYRGTVASIAVLTSLGAVIETVKRGAMLALVVAAIGYWLLYVGLHRNRRGLSITLIISSVAVTTTSIVAWLNWDAIAHRWEQVSDPINGGSGRAVFWDLIAQHWMSAGLLTKCIGFGPHSTYDLTGTLWLAAIPAHNDWLNILHEFGILGLLPYAVTWIVMASSIRGVTRYCRDWAPAYYAVLAVAFCLGMVDLFAYSPKAIWFSVFVGAVLAIYERSRAEDRARVAHASE